MSPLEPSIWNLLYSSIRSQVVKRAVTCVGVALCSCIVLLALVETFLLPAYTSRDRLRERKREVEDPGSSPVTSKLREAMLHTKLAHWPWLYRHRFESVDTTSLYLSPRSFSLAICSIKPGNPLKYISKKRRIIVTSLPYNNHIIAVVQKHWYRDASAWDRTGKSVITQALVLSLFV